MSLAAVILNFKDAGTTIDAAKRVGGFSCVDHVVIVDNASPDDSAAKISSALELIEQQSGIYTASEQKCRKFTLIVSEKNGGYGSGNNMGVRFAYDQLKANEVLIANPDAEVTEETVRKMQEIMESDPKIACVGAVMRMNALPEVTYQEYLAAGWCERSLLQEVLHSGPVCKRLFREALEYPENYYRNHTPVPVYAVHGSLLLVSAKAFLDAGGYDPEMFLYMEEYTLGKRLQKAGFKTFLIHEGYLHQGSHSITGSGLGAVRRQKIRQKSELIYYRNYLGAGTVQMGLIRIFQMIVLLETKLAVLLHRM